MAKPDRIGKSLPEIADMVGIGRVGMHLFLCTGPDCCTPEEGMAAWQALKHAVKELNPALREARIYRTKVNCLRICKDGPIAVCYPQGQWFHGVTENKVAELVRYLQDGAVGDHPLQFCTHPLPNPEPPDATE
jgi:(2Fe-2S) ferredoxin